MSSPCPEKENPSTAWGLGASTFFYPFYCKYYCCAADYTGYTDIGISANMSKASLSQVLEPSSWSPLELINRMTVCSLHISAQLCCSFCRRQWCCYRQHCQLAITTQSYWCTNGRATPPARPISNSLTSRHSLGNMMICGGPGKSVWELL